LKKGKTFSGTWRGIRKPPEGDSELTETRSDVKLQAEYFLKKKAIREEGKSS
jgi:hypothetical protein